MSERKLRILFVRPSMGHGGADRVTLNILQGFDRSMYECDLALMKKKGELIEDVPADIKVIETGSATPLLMYRPLMSLINSGKYDVVYSTSGGTNIPLAFAASIAKRKVTTVLSERSALFAPGKNKTKQRLYHWLKKLTYNKADHVTVVSKALSIQLAEHLKVNPAKLNIVNNPMVNDGLMAAKEAALDNPVFKQGEPVILAVGRLIPLKDYSTLLKAFQIVNAAVPSQLYILGKGPLEDSLKEQAKRLSLDDRVHFGGFDKNPFRYMKHCSVFVLSSRHEGMPGVLIQAMACGAPCVSTDCPTGPAEIIEHGVTGFLAEVGNADDIAQCILRLLKDRKLSEAIATKGQKSIAVFEEQEAIKSYLSFIVPVANTVG